MIIDTITQLKSRWSKTALPSVNTKRPSLVLMGAPDFFDIEYSINPYMSSSGELNKIDQDLAQRQWEALKNKYKSLGLRVEVINAEPGLPDFVFAANQSFPFWDMSVDKPSVIMSQMRSEFRRSEVAIFEKWYRSRGYVIHHLRQKHLSFEGNGDVLIHPGRKLIWGGTGPRTDRGIYEEVSEITGYDVAILPLILPEFYHLDTCFSILNEKSVVIQPTAFPPSALELIRYAFENVIETDSEECMSFFTANCHCPDGKNVIVQSGASRFENELTRAGFIVHSVDTTEYLKSGGSIFCMKMMAY